MMNSKDLDEVRLEISSRPASFKNNRVLRMGYGKPMSRKSDYASQSIETAKWEIKSQWKGVASEDKWDIEVFYYYKNKKGWLDPDGAFAYVLDVLKGIVIADDSHKYVGSSHLHEPEVSRLEKDHIEIILRKVK